jgi:hypothetical protein
MLVIFLVDEDKSPASSIELSVHCSAVHRAFPVLKKKKNSKRRKTGENKKEVP